MNWMSSAAQIEQARLDELNRKAEARAQARRCREAELRAAVAEQRAKKARADADAAAYRNGEAPARATTVAAEGVVYTDMESAMKGECTAYLGSADLARLPADFEARLCSALSAKGSTCTLSKEAARIESGIMLVYGDIEVNCTFEAVIESSAEELKAQIGEMIF